MTVLGCNPGKYLDLVTLFHGRFMICCLNLGKVYERHVFGHTDNTFIAKLKCCGAAS